MDTKLTQISKSIDKFLGVDFGAVITDTDTWSDGRVMYRAKLTEQIDGLGQFSQPLGLGDNQDQAWDWLYCAMTKLFYTFRLRLVEDGRTTREITYREEHGPGRGECKPGNNWVALVGASTQAKANG